MLTRLLTLATLLLCLFGCERPDPTIGTLSENVGASFSPCSEAEIKFMASKHNFMPSFRPCGENSFSSYAWSPEGTHLYFQLVMTPYLMDARTDQKPTIAVPTSTPIGDGAWVTKHRLVVPVGPSEEVDNNRLAIYDLEQRIHVDA